MLTKCPLPLLLAAALASAALGCVAIVVKSGETPERLQSDVEMMRQALADVRIVGTAIESYSVDTNQYPTASAPELTLGELAGGYDREAERIISDHQDREDE